MTLIDTNNTQIDDDTSDFDGDIDLNVSSETNIKTLEYIASMSNELIKMAVENKMHMVAYFLHMAKQEAIGNTDKIISN